LTAPQRRNPTDEMKAERDRYVSFAFSWADLLFELDRQFGIVFAAGALEAFFGRSAQEIVGRSFRELIAPADVPVVCQALTLLPRTGRIHDEVVRIVDGRQGLLWMSMSACCLDPNGGNIYVGMRKSTAEARAAALSYPRHETTGLFDSGSFAELAADRLKKIRAAGAAAEVTLVSVPEMEALRGRLGPEPGAALLHRVGDVLKANSVGGDSAAAIAGGKFSIMHAANTNVAEVKDQIERLTRSADPTGQGVRVDAATMALDAETVDEGDLAKGLLYMFRKFSEDDDTNVHDLIANIGHVVDKAVAEINGFKQVISSSEFHVLLQPIIHATTGEIHHYEALCRFAKNPGESPFKTIAFAEETGLIHEFDLAMAKKVIGWLGKRPRNSDKYNVAVNVSGFSIGQSSYFDALMELLRENEWTKGKLTFEITESSRMSNLEEANNFIKALRQQGYQVSLDDFGAGAASFQYLSVLDVDLVKLDGSAIKNAQRAKKGRAFLSALTELCRRMAVGTIAEMVDTAETLEFVRNCGCDYVQGYLFGKPSRDIKDFALLEQAKLFPHHRAAAMRVS
jgi:PAS domain S-box-containing protein